jgi:hypothetical protein
VIPDQLLDEFQWLKLPRFRELRLDRHLCSIPESFHGTDRATGISGDISISVSLLVAADTKSYEIRSRIIAQLAPRLNVMDLKAFDTPARLTTPVVPLQNFTAELAISLRLEPQARLFGSNSSQGTT